MFNPPNLIKTVIITVDCINQDCRYRTITGLKSGKWILTSLTSLFSLPPQLKGSRFPFEIPLTIFAFSPDENRTSQLEVIHAWKCDYVADFLQSRNLTESNMPSNIEIDWFVLFHELIPGIESLTLLPEAIREGMIAFSPPNGGVLRGGLKILVEACAFITMCAYTSGIVANTFCDGHIFIIDTYLRPDTEGSPIYRGGNTDEACGMVACSVTSRNSYPVCVSLSHIVNEGLKSLPVSDLTLPTIFGGACTYDNGPPVVKILFEDSCGTGTVIHPFGLIATCAHVVKYQGFGAVQMIYNGESIVGDIVFSSSISDPLDIAFIKANMEFEHMRPIHEFESIPLIGEPIYAKGINPSSWHTFLHSGIVSNCLDMFSPIYADAKAVPGNSGGALIREDGELLGIILGNIVDTYNECSPSALIMCTPIQILMNAIKSFDLNGDIGGNINDELSVYHFNIWRNSMDGLYLR